MIDIYEESVLVSHFLSMIYSSITSALMTYMYYAGSTEQAKKESVYYQRFIAKKDEHH
jgi:hypothetical protein